MRRNLYLFIFLLLVTVSATAINKDNQRYYYKHLDIQNGLSQNTVHCILQDSRGFMWFGTKDGLNRYDGVTFKTFIRGSNNEYNCSFVKALFEDKNGNIWIGTDKGVCIYSPVTEQIKMLDAVTDKGVKVTNTVTSFTSDAKGNVWFVVEDTGVFSYNIDKEKLTNYPVQDFRITNSNLTYIAIDDKDRIWLGFFGDGLYYSTDKLKTMHPFIDDKGVEVFDNQVVTKIYQGNYNYVYVSTEQKGLMQINLTTNNIKELFTHNYKGEAPYIRDFMFASEEEIWIGTETGVYIYDMQSGAYRHYQHSAYDIFSLSDNAVYAISQDKEGGIWIGTYFGGVNYMPMQNTYFEKYYQNDAPSSLHGQRVREFCQDHNDNIWIGTEDGGLNKFNPKTKKIEFVEASRNFTNIHGLCIDGDNLWIGTFSKGLKMLNTKTNQMRSYNQDGAGGLVSDCIFSICRTRSGEIYVGSFSGLQYYDRAADKFYSVPEIKDKFVYDIVEDSNGNLWVATYANGVYCHDAKHNIWKSYACVVGDSTTIPSNKAYGVYEDSKHTVWIMTQAGLCSYQPKTDNFSSAIHSKDFPTGVVYQMQEDNAGTYWITTNRGLYNINPKTSVVNKYTVANGLTSNQFNYCSSYKSSDGTIYFGSIDGFITFQPSAFVPSKPLPKPLITDMWLFNKHVEVGGKDSPLSKSITMTDKIELGADQNSLSFQIVTLSYAAPSMQRLKYKLEGFDHDWNYVSMDRSRITYSNLDYGTYTLKVMAYNDNGESNEEYTTLKIVIHPPFYLSIWAYIIYAIMIVIGIYVTIRFFHYRNLRKSNARLDKFKQEQEHEMYNSKIEFFTNVAHEIRTPLTLIKAPLENVMKHEKLDTAVQEDLDIMNMNVERLLLLTNQLLDFRKTESKKFQLKREKCNINEILKETHYRFAPTAQKRNVKFDLELPDTDVFANVDKEAFTKIISNMFTNAIKYSASYIKIQLNQSEDKTVTVKAINDGNVIPANMREEVFTAFTRIGNGENSTGTGIGLPFARSLAELHNGTLKVCESDTENIFLLTLPYGEEVSQKKSNDMQDASIEGIIQRNDAKLNILVVEDNAEMRKFIERQLITQSYNVFCACNGVEAMKVLGAQSVNLIISDVMMPEMDGFELCKAVKSDLQYSHIPVILLTAKTNMQSKIEGLEIGADSYIEKPFSIEYLLTNITSLLRNRERLRKSFEKQPFATTGAVGMSKMDEEFLRKLNEIIQANFQNPEFNMDDVVETLNMSRSSFYRKIKGILDLTPNDYIRMERLKKAAQLLCEGNNNVTEICYMVGFNSPSYFAKCFQKQYGVLPKDFVG